MESILADVFNAFRAGAVLRGNLDEVAAVRETRFHGGEWCPRDCGSWVRWPVGGTRFEAMNDHFWYGCPLRPAPTE